MVAATPTPIYQPSASPAPSPKAPSGVQMGARPVPTANAGGNKAAAAPTLSQIIPQGTVPKQTAIVKIYARADKVLPLSNRVCRRTVAETTSAAFIYFDVWLTHARRTGR